MSAVRRALPSLALAAVLASPAAAAEPGVEELRLENGLTVLLRPVAGAEGVALVVAFSLGQRNDPPGECGLAHMVEHLYVTCAAGATPARTADEFMAAYPAGWNAQTGDDHTVFATVFPKGGLAAEVAEAAARMGDLRIEAKDVERERPRILAELETMFRGPSILAARNQSVARIERSCAAPGGIPESVARITVEGVRNAWKRWYRPRRATVAIAGGFDPAEARALVEKHFGPLPRGEDGEPVQWGLERSPGVDLPPRPVVVPIPARAGDEGRVAISIGISLDPAHWGRVVLFASRIVFGGSDPVLHYAPLDGPGVLTVSSPRRTGESPAQALARLEERVASLAKAPPSVRDRRQAIEQFGPLLGMKSVPDHLWKTNLYGLAYGIARRRQLGLDPARLRASVEGATDAQLVEIAESLARSQAAVVVVPEPPASAPR